MSYKPLAQIARTQKPKLGKLMQVSAQSVKQQGMK